MQGQTELEQTDFARQREVARVFLMASRGGDFHALLAVLDPDVINRLDAVAAPPRGLEIRGATSFSSRGQFSRLAFINGAIGIVVAPQGRLQLVLLLTIADDKISALEIVADPTRLATFDIRVLEIAERWAAHFHQTETLTFSRPRSKSVRRFVARGQRPSRSGTRWLA